MKYYCWDEGNKVNRGGTTDSEHSGTFIKTSSDYIVPEYLYFEGTEHFGTFWNIH